MRVSPLAMAATEPREHRASLPAANVLTRGLIRSLCSILNSEIMFREVEDGDRVEEFPYWIEGVVKGEIEGVVGLGTDQPTLRSLAMSLKVKDSTGKIDLDATLVKIHQAISLEIEKQFVQDDFQCRLGPVTGVQHAFEFAPRSGPCLICPVETKFGLLHVFFSLEGSTATVLSELMRVGGHAGEKKVRVFSSQIEALCRHVNSLEALEERLLAGVHVRSQMRTEIKKVKRILQYVKCEPLEMVFVPARRLVTELCKEHGKQIRLISHGTWLYLDKTLLGHIYEPILHLVRNAVDHGIENLPERERRGKPAIGTIRCLAAFTSGGLRMIVSDDGQGLDLVRIRAAAVSKGLITGAESQNLMMSEIGNLAFECGLSTRDRSDGSSGRGLGLSSVQKTISALGGSVRILSTSHHGTSFELVIPLDRSLQLVNQGDAAGVSDSATGDSERVKMTEELSQYLDRLDITIGVLKRDPSTVAAYESFRLAHSIKGVAGFLGWSRVVSFCSELEDLLKSIANEKVALKSTLLDLLVGSCAALREFCDASASDTPFPLIKIKRLEGQLLQQLWSCGQSHDKDQFYFGKYHLKAVRELIAPAAPRSALAAKPDGDFGKAIAQPLGAIVQYSGDRRGYLGILMSDDALLNVVHPFITGRVEPVAMQDRLWALNEFARLVGSQFSSLCQKEGIKMLHSAPLAYYGWGQPLKVLGTPSYCYLCELHGHAFYLVGDFVLPHDAAEKTLPRRDFNYHPPVIIREATNRCRELFGKMDLPIQFEELSTQSDLFGFEGGVTSVITCLGNPSTILFMSFEKSLATYLLNLNRQQKERDIDIYDYLNEIASAFGSQLVSEMGHKDIKLELSLPSVFVGQAYVANFNQLYLSNKLAGTTPQGGFELNVLVTQILGD